MKTRINKGKKEFAWRLLVSYSGRGNLHNPCNDDTEIILLDREPTARDLRRFNSEYFFRKCWHSQSQPSPNFVEYCGWMEFAIKRGDDKKKHGVGDPCYRAEVDRYDLPDLEKRCIDLEGQKFAVWRHKLPVPVYKSLDEYFDEQKKK